MSTYPATSSIPQSGSIVSRWLLDEASGNRADIVSTNTLTDNATVTAGAGFTNAASATSFDNSADFELSNSEYLSRADNAGLSITGNLSFSALVNLESSPGAGGSYPFMGKFSANKSYWLGYNNNAGTFRLLWQISSDGSAESTAVVNQTLNTATWYHVGVSYNAAAGSAAFYVGGLQSGSTQTGLATSIADTNAEFRLGSRELSSLFYDGLMQDAILWGGATLSAADWLSLNNLYTTAPASSNRYSFFM